MAEIPFPSGDLQDVQIELDQNYQVNRSEWTGRRRGSQMPGAQKWYGSASVFGIATEDDERPWRLFKIAMRGPVNWTRFPIACSQHAGPNPTVRAGASALTTLPLSGLPASRTVLKAGQYMTVPLPSGRWRLVMLMADLVSNGSGQGTATFIPELGEIPTTGATVETINPFLMASFVDSRQGWKVSDGVTDMPLAFEEA